MTRKTEAVAAAPSKVGRPLGMIGPLGELAEAMGGRRALAKALGVAEGSIHRWYTGRSLPPKTTRMVLHALAIANNVTPPFSIEDECPRPAWLDLVDRDPDDE